MYKNDYSVNESYSKGYFKALLDIYNFLDEYSASIKRYRLNNIKGLKKLLSAFISKKDDMIKWGHNVDLIIMPDKENPRVIKELRIGPPQE